MAMTPARVRTIEMTMAKRGRSINTLENVLISSIAFLILSFIFPPVFRCAGASKPFAHYFSIMRCWNLGSRSSFAVGFASVTFMPFTSLRVPEMTTLSPGLTPSVTGTQPSNISSVLTLRISTVSSALITYTPTLPPVVSTIACCGTQRYFGGVLKSTRSVT